MKKNKKYNFQDINYIFIDYNPEKGLYLKKGMNGEPINYKDESFLNNYGIDGEFEFLVFPSFDEKSEEWPSLLNFFSNRGYNIKLIFYDVCDEVDCGLVDTFENLSKERDLILNKDRISIGIQGSDDYNEMDFNEFISIDDAIELCVQDIKSHNLSPFENIVAAYKVSILLFYNGRIRENVGEKSYNMYFSIENYQKDITPMCQTFAQIFMTICQRLGLDCKYGVIDSDSINMAYHAINYMHVVDEKYGIDGNYLFDPTMGNSFAQALGRDGEDINSIMIGFGLGKNSEQLSKYYYPEINEHNSDFFSIKNIGDEDIPKDVLKSALKVVNSSFIEESKGNNL